MRKKAKTLMIQGSASNVGKSLLCTALCRIYRNMGYKVAPFKAQNMSNNSFATPDGGEIGRAQAAQAEACGMDPSPLMNPILLKPNTDKKAQVIVLGKAQGVCSAKEYSKLKPTLLPVISAALEKLRDDCDILIIEGAGSPSEINLKSSDIVNMRIAQMADAPVIIAGDIDKGGVFAQLIGTFHLLEPWEKRKVRAFIINKFRGDPQILKPGLKQIEKRTGRKVLGVIPYIPDPAIAEEDSVSLYLPPPLSRGLFTCHKGGGDNNQNGLKEKSLQIDILRFPRISNFTDFDPLLREKGCSVKYLTKLDRHRFPDLIILPGTKSTMADLKFLRESGFADYLSRCARLGIPILGICGGYQMLGKNILDPSHTESDKGSCEGLGLLPHSTVFQRNKTTAQIKAVHLESGLKISGYEIHMGCTQGRPGETPLFKITERYGMSIEDFDGINHFPVMGTYLHGIFDSDEFRKYFLGKIRKTCGLPKGLPAGRQISDPYDSLASIVKRNIDVAFLNRVMGL